MADVRPEGHDMAESIIIHFRTHAKADIESAIERQFVRGQNSSWCFPVADYLVLVTQYKDYDAEYEEHEKAVVRTKLGGDPDVSFDFQIRRSKSDDACDVIENFVRTMLSQLDYVVDDMTRILSRADLEQTHDFLDEYRYHACPVKS